jgi:hypothetical protein
VVQHHIETCDSKFFNRSQFIIREKYSVISILYSIQPSAKKSSDNT